jgi:hypothetical protein
MAASISLMVGLMQKSDQIGTDPLFYLFFTPFLHLFTSCVC